MKHGYLPAHGFRARPSPQAGPAIRLGWEQTWRTGRAVVERRAARVRLRRKANVKKLYLLVLGAGILAGCAIKQPEVGTYYDPYTHARTDLTANNLLESSGAVREIVSLNASRVFLTASEYQYYLEVDYLARSETGFLEIPPGETLVILADGQELKFSGSGSINSRKERKGEVTERAIYAATAQQLRTIAGAETVKVSILGRNGIVQRDFTPANFEKFRKFVQMFGTPA